MPICTVIIEQNRAERKGEIHFLGCATLKALIYLGKTENSRLIMDLPNFDNRLTKEEMDFRLPGDSPAIAEWNRQFALLIAEYKTALAWEDEGCVGDRVHEVRKCKRGYLETDNQAAFLAEIEAQTGVGIIIKPTQNFAQPIAEVTNPREAALKMLKRGGVIR